MKDICPHDVIVEALIALTGLTSMSCQGNSDHLVLSRDDLNYRGISPPDLLPEEITELIAFLLLVQPDVYSYLSVH